MGLIQFLKWIFSYFTKPAAPQTDGNAKIDPTATKAACPFATMGATLGLSSPHPAPTGVKKNE